MRSGAGRGAPKLEAMVVLVQKYGGSSLSTLDKVRAVAQRVEVVSKKEVRIRGLRSELLRTLTAASGVEAAALGVRAFEPKWRARLDSNQRPQA